LHGRLDGGVAGDDDEFEIGSLLAHGGENLHAVEVGHAHVEQDEVVGAGGRAVAARERVRLDVDGAAVAFEDAPAAFEHDGFVVDDENAGGRGGRDACSGAPCGGAGRQRYCDAGGRAPRCRR